MRDTVAERCDICTRIAAIEAGENPFFVAELKTGYVVLGDHQTFHGYTLFLYKEHVEELYELDQRTKKDFLVEMSLVAEAVARAFTPDKINYELLGNTDRHLHWHIFPRYTNDLAPGQPIWVVPKEKRNALIPSKAQLAGMRSKLRAALKKSTSPSPERGDA